MKIKGSLSKKGIGIKRIHTLNSVTSKPDFAPIESSFGRSTKAVGDAGTMFSKQQLSIFREF